MQALTAVVILVLAYLLGAIPFGLIIVKVRTGKDIRRIESGRTGGTNAMRAAGWGAGILTVVFDILKGAGAVWMARAVGGSPWLEVFAPLMAICGHNYSIFLMERDEKGRLRLRGGAGGAPSAGGAFGLWPPILLIIIPLGFAIFYGIGYASVTTMSVALITTVVFAVRAALGLSPWQYVLYGLLAEALLVWALRPNIRRLRNGTERLHGWRAKRRKKASSTTSLEGGAGGR